jgi:hypothetical protein
MVVPVLCTKAAEVAPEQLVRQAMVAAHAADDGSGGDDTIVGAGRLHGSKEEGERVELDALIYIRRMGEKVKVDGDGRDDRL